MVELLILIEEEVPQLVEVEIRFEETIPISDGAITVGIIMFEEDQPFAEAAQVEILTQDLEEEVLTAHAVREVHPAAAEEPPQEEEGDN